MHCYVLITPPKNGQATTKFTLVVNGVFSVGHQVADGENAVVFGTRGTVDIDADMYIDAGNIMVDLVLHIHLEAIRMIGALEWRWPHHDSERHWSLMHNYRQIARWIGTR